jgi:predicted glycoside hydrolase/deacetylase ChbG (UPF0249 family)
MKCLIVNADDYGHSPGVSEGIRRAHLEGIVTSTSAMMNGTYIDQELPDLLKQCPRIGAGVHLVITSGKPLLPIAALPGIMRLSVDGEHFNKDIAGVIDQIDAAEVKAEWQAQIEKFIRLAGRAPDHLDAHHHAMCFDDRCFKVYLELAEKYGCGVRPPVEGSPQLWNQMACDYKIPMPDRLDTRFYDEGVKESMLETMIADLPEGSMEWMCHPAVVDHEIMNTSDYNMRRGVELDLLTRPILYKKLEAAGVRLINFGELTGLRRGRG